MVKLIGSFVVAFIVFGIILALSNHAVFLATSAGNVTWAFTISCVVFVGCVFYG